MTKGNLRLTLVLILILQACAIPVPVVKTEITSPGVSGIIVDKATGQPLDGVAVWFEGREGEKITSSSAGMFKLPFQKDLVLLEVHTPCPIYQYPAPRRFPSAILTQKDGYEPSKLELKPYYDRINEEADKQNKPYPRAFVIDRIVIELEKGR